MSRAVKIKYTSLLSYTDFAKFLSTRVSEKRALPFGDYDTYRTNIFLRAYAGKELGEGESPPREEKCR